MLPIFRTMLSALEAAIERTLEEEDAPLEALPVPEAKTVSDFRPLTYEEHRTAVHEAGHAIAFWHNPYVRRIRSVRLHSRGGDVLSEITAQGGVKALWYELAANLAGFAAEMAEFSKVSSTPCKSDLGKARATAREIVRLRGQDNSPWKETLDFPFDVGQVYKAGSLSPAVIQVLNIAYAWARALYVKNPRRSVHLVRLLSEHRTLGEPELKKVFGKRKFTF